MRAGGRLIFGSDAASDRMLTLGVKPIVEGRFTTGPEKHARTDHQLANVSAARNCSSCINSGEIDIPRFKTPVTNVCFAPTHSSRTTLRSRSALSDMVILFQS